MIEYVTSIDSEAKDDDQNEMSMPDITLTSQDSSTMTLAYQQVYNPSDGTEDSSTGDITHTCLTEVSIPPTTSLHSTSTSEHQAETVTDTPWQAMENDAEKKGCGTAFKAYYDIFKKEYLIRNNIGWIHQTESQLKRRLKRAKIPTRAPDGELLSPADEEILRIQDYESVHYAGPLAGYREGFFEDNGLRVLITEGPRLIEPQKGDWTTLQAVFEAVLSDDEHDQLRVFYGWLQIAIQALREGSLMPGQALVMAGMRGCGKSLIQNQITQLLGGRSAKPYQFMTGGTDFNSELFKAEHLMIEDEAPSTAFKSRRNLGSFIKQFTVNTDQRLHAKGRDAIMLKPFWRVSITLNDEPEDLHVLPLIDSSLEDKLILLRVYKRDLPMPTSSSKERKLFEEKLRSEMPAFIDWLLNEFSIPEELKADRFGVTHFHHPELLEMLNEISSESQLMALIEKHVPLPFEGTAAALEAVLYENARTQTMKLLSFTGATGTFLARLAKEPNSRISKKKTAHCNLWSIEECEELKALRPSVPKHWGGNHGSFLIKDGAA